MAWAEGLPAQKGFSSEAGPASKAWSESTEPAVLRPVVRLYQSITGPD